VADDPVKRLRKAARLLSVAADAAERGDGGRDGIDVALVDAVGAQRQLYGPRPRAKKGEGALHKLRDYLIAHVGEEVSGEELRYVSGIQEWARRVRELRVEHGYEITEQSDLYRLETVEPDAVRAARWQTLNGIRRTKGSGDKRIKLVFEAFVGEVIDGDTIAYVAKIKSAPRRVREIRDEDGWPINSNIDEKGLKPGEYRLVSSDPADRRDPRQRIYELDVRENVFKRDNYTCQSCGRNREAAQRAGDTRFYLEIHHKTAVAEQLDALPQSELNKEENLITLCHADHLKETANLQKRLQAERRRG
jgi:5-methylcytosine-specific restriction endonuclease McrA